MGKLNIRKERYSSPLALEPRWKENLRCVTRKIDDIFAKIDASTRQQRYALKGILYRKPKDTNKINDECRRLNPKIWLMVLGFVIFTLSAFSAFTHLVSDDILKIALPWALGLKGVPPMARRHWYHMQDMDVLHSSYEISWTWHLEYQAKDIVSRYA